MLLVGFFAAFLNQTNNSHLATNHKEASSYLQLAHTAAHSSNDFTFSQHSYECSYLIFMANNTQIYENPLKNTIFNIFLHASIVISLIVNVTLITLILRCRPKEFGSYRFLLLTFASVDIYYGIVHFLVIPIPEEWGNAFYMGAHGYVTGRIAVGWFASAHSHSFVVLVFHFLYRFLAVKGSYYIDLFSRRWFYGVQLACVIIVGASWFSVIYYLFDADQFVVEYMEPILREHTIGNRLSIDEYSTAVFWLNGSFVGPRWKPISGLLVLASTMSCGYGFMIYAAYKIGWHMKTNSIGRSKRTNELQNELLRALIYQTLLPLITAYSPPLISVVFPFLGISFPIIADISPVFCGFHPWLDGCVLIWTIKEYRMTLFRCFHKRPPPTLSTTLSR